MLQAYKFPQNPKVSHIKLRMMNYPSNLHTTLGLLEIGVLISVFLLGALTVQVYMYYHKYSSDSWKIKLLVCYRRLYNPVDNNVFCILEYRLYQYGKLTLPHPLPLTFTHLISQSRLLELGHSICSCHGLYIYSIVRYGQSVESIVTFGPESLRIITILSAPVASLVQVKLSVQKQAMTDWFHHSDMIAY